MRKGLQITPPPGVDRHIAGNLSVTPGRRVRIYLFCFVLIRLPPHSKSKVRTASVSCGKTKPFLSYLRLKPGSYPFSCWWMQREWVHVRVSNSSVRKTNTKKQSLEVAGWRHGLICIISNLHLMDVKWGKKGLTTSDRDEHDALNDDDDDDGTPSPNYYF